MAIRFLFGVAIALLQLAAELIPFARNGIKIIIGELAPLFFGFALKLFPLTCDLIPCYRGLLSL